MSTCYRFLKRQLFQIYYVLRNSESISKIFVVQVFLHSTLNLILPDTFLPSRTYNQTPFCKTRARMEKEQTSPPIFFFFFLNKASGDRLRVTEESGSPRPSSQRGQEGAHSQGWKARSPAPAHPRLGLAGHAVIQRRHVRAAAPSLLPPPSPRAWQEKRATWSGNKGPRGPRRSGTRGHPTPGPRHRCSPGPAPRPHAPSPGRSPGRESRPRERPRHRESVPDSGKGDSRVLLPAVIPAACRPDPGPRESQGQKLPPYFLCPSSLRGGPQPPRPPTRLGNHGSAGSAGPARRQLLAPRKRQQRLGASSPGTRTLLRASHRLPSRSRHPSARTPVAPSSSSTVWNLRVLPGSSLKRWKNSCLELRWGAGGSGRESAQRKAPRGRGTGERLSGKTSSQPQRLRGGAAPPRVRGDSLARWHCRAEAAGGETVQLSSERPTSTRVPETLPPPPPRSRRTPSHVTTCAAAVPAAAANVSRQLPARIRQRITSEHEKAPARGPAHRSPSLSFALLGSFLLGSTRSRQGKQLLNEKPFLGRDSPPEGGGLNEDCAAIEGLADVISCLFLLLESPIDTSSHRDGPQLVTQVPTQM
ncbi:serine/arginine repetitive matrix protein 1-like [Lutra lutra]|uniref:serine/arginine repetitive matrix protein 1-like n=1 Tax=Lutra lutra TaxID=9657 RepID=UPI001FD4B4D1|nr:serine/arginine repetitive matrix protein 1-like [Lutra lutra]